MQYALKALPDRKSDPPAPLSGNLSVCLAWPAQQQPFWCWLLFLQVIPNLIPGGRQATAENSSLTDAGGSRQETNAATYAGTSDAAVPNSDGFSVWHTGKTVSTTLVVGQTAAEDCLGNFKAETLTELDMILNEATEIRYASRSGPAPQTSDIGSFWRI